MWGLGWFGFWGLSRGLWTVLHGNGNVLIFGLLLDLMTFRFSMLLLSCLLHTLSGS